MKLTSLTALLVLVLGTGVASAGMTSPTTGGYPPTTPPPTSSTTTTPTTTTTTTTTTTPSTTTTEALVAAAGQAQGGLPQTGSSSTISTVWIAVGLVVLGTALMFLARRRHSGTRAH